MTLGLHWMAWLPPAEVFALCLVRCRLCRGLSFGEGVTLPLQASDAVHLGVDHPNVVRHAGRLLVGVPAPRPVELDDDGDLIGIVRKMVCSWDQCLHFNGQRS